jgi:hypothetical protein
MKEVDMFFGGFVTGTLIVVLTLAFTPGTFTRAAHALGECEKSLPRDQECVIIAIPKDKK